MTIRFALPDARGHRRLLAGLSIDALGSGLFLPFSLLFFTATTDLSLVSIGLALSIAAFVRFPATAAAGFLADRFGAGTTVVFSAIAQAVGFLGYVFVDGFGGLIAAAVLVQIGNSAFWVGYPGLVEDAASGRAQERWFALIGALRSSGIAVGALGASLAVAVGGRSGFIAIAVINAVSFAGAAILVALDRRTAAGRPRPAIPTRTADRASWRTVLLDRPFVGFVAINTGFALLSLSFFVGVPVFLVEQANLPAWAPGMIVALNAVLGAIAAVPIVSLIEGRRRHRILVLSQVIIAAGFACILFTASTPLVWSLALAVVAVLLITTTELIQGPVVPAIVNDSAGSRDRGRYTSLYQLAFVIGDLITPAMITVLLSRGAVATWLPLIALALINAAGVIFLSRWLPPLRRSIGYVREANEAVGSPESQPAQAKVPQ